MPTKAKRIKAPAIANRAIFERLLDEIAANTVELRRCQAARDARVLVAQVTYKEEIEAYQAAINAKAALCEKYAEEHRDELLPGKAKSAETSLARFGFRTGNPKLKLLPRFTWAGVLEAIKAACHASNFVRLIEEVNKEALLAAWDENMGAPLFRVSKDRWVHPQVFGCKVVQEESFFIEPKVDGAEQVKVAS